MLRGPVPARFYWGLRPFFRRLPGDGRFVACEQQRYRPGLDSFTRIPPARPSHPRHCPDTAAAHFDKAEPANLVIAIATINVWNRRAIATRTELPG
jgi:alkylhydroperoxidase family enzyme